MNNTGAFILAGTVAVTDCAIKSCITDVPVKNYGFAGNKMDGFPKAVCGVSTVLTFVMCGALALSPKRFKLPLALILGGAVSNTLDRVVRGYVVDYIPMGRGVYGNLSDLSIFTGTAVGMVKYILEDEEEKPSATGPDMV